MISIRANLYLLAFPMGLMGLVQASFALLSLMMFHDYQAFNFGIPAVLIMFTALCLSKIDERKDIEKIRFRDAMVFAVATWVLSGFLGALPIINATDVSVTDAVFESVSALTTTGATILSGLDAMPPSFLMYRQFLQWMGGLGVVIFVVAVLPLLNVGGMRLLKAETPGPIKDDKVSPRVYSAAHCLWLVYLCITFLCAVSYYIAGMSAYDALAHSFTTVSTGGFSTHDASMGYFKSPAVLIVSDIFMLLGAISFALHFRVGRALNARLYWRDEETRGFIVIVIFLSGLITFFLIEEGVYDNGLHALNDAVFILISFITSTGYGTGEFTQWPYAIVMILIFAGYLGGCAGSTAGGNKIIRSILCLKLIWLQIQRLGHPFGFFTVKYQGETVESTVITATFAFLFFVGLISVLLTIILMATGLDFFSALTAVAACLNVLGPGFGVLGGNFEPVSDVGTWVLSFAMILGRLEYFTVLALLMPSFWNE